MSPPVAAQVVALRRGYIARAGKNDWRTPPEIVDLLHVTWKGGPDLDPCASPDPAHHLARLNIAPPKDGLALPWRGRVYVNPPFDALAAWVAKCERAHEDDGAEVVLLMPARTDTRYWQTHVARAAAICFWRGRLRFVGAAASCPFPTALVYWGAKPWCFHRTFRAHGHVVAP